MKPSFVYDLLLVTGGRLATIAAQLAFVKLYTHLFSTTELGFYFFWQTISYSMTALVFVPLDQFQQVNLHNYRHQGLSLQSFVPLNVIPIGFFLALGIVLSTVWSMATHTIMAAPFFGVTLAVTTHLSGALRNASNNMGHRRLAVIFSFLDVALRLGFLFVLAQLFSLRSTSILLTTSLAGATVTVCILPFFWYWNIWGKGKIRRPNLREFLMFAWPITLGACLNWLQVQSSRFLVPLGFAEAIGIFGTVSAIGQAGMQAAANVYQMMFLPELYRSFGQAMKRYISLGLALILFVLAISTVIDTKLVALLTNATFVPYAYCVLFGITIEAGNFFIGSIGIYMQVHRKTHYGLLASILAFVASIGPMGVLYFLHAISPLTIGLVAAFSQGVAVIANFAIYYYMKRQYLREDEALRAKWKFPPPEIDTV